MPICPEPAHEAEPPPLALRLGAPDSNEHIGAELRQADGSVLHFGSLPELIRWLAQLELAHRRGGGGIR